MNKERIIICGWTSCIKNLKEICTAEKICLTSKEYKKIGYILVCEMYELKIKVESLI